MNHLCSFSLAALVLALAATGANAQANGPRTRDEVRRELADAIRLGTLSFGETGATMRELFPGRYAALPPLPGKTRDQVLAEYEQARRDGDLPADGESGQTMRERYPDRYPQRATAFAKSREQVKAELADAQRNGDVYAGGEAGLTLRQLYPNRYPDASRPVFALAPADAASAVAR